MRNKKLIASVFLLMLLGMLAFIVIFGIIGGMTPPDSESPVVTPDSPVGTPVDKRLFAVASVTATTTMTATPAETPTATPTHWTSYSVSAHCTLIGISQQPLELYYRQGETPLLALNFNVQLRDDEGNVLVPQASLNILDWTADEEPCAGEFLRFDYDWREYEDVGIPGGSFVYEYAKMSFQKITTGTVYVMEEGATTPVPWNPDDQEVTVVDVQGTQTLTNGWTFVRSYQWASPTPTATDTPTATATPTATPESPLIRIYLPVIFKYGW